MAGLALEVVITVLFLPLIVGVLTMTATAASMVGLTIGELRVPASVRLLRDRVEFVNHLGRSHEVEYPRLVRYRKYKMPGGQRVLIFAYRPRKWIVGLSPLTVTEEIGRLILEKTDVYEVGGFPSLS